MKTLSTHRRGEHVEHKPWKIIKDYRGAVYDLKKICPHVENVHLGRPSGVTQEYLYTVPYVVQAIIEDCYNSTAVCLQCIQDALPEELTRPICETHGYGCDLAEATCRVRSD
jgi:hypothetical protein